MIVRLLGYLLRRIYKYLVFQIMCIFSNSVSLVEGTRIFARRSTESKQFLVYSMAYKADQDMAMILPLPVGSRDEDNAVRFIALDGYTNFFGDMLIGGFPELMPEISRAVPENSGRSAVDPLKVYEVGDYDASFIPTLNDFDRLDPQFKLSGQVWDQLPEYKSYGFAVFKLRASNHGRKHRWLRSPSPSRIKKPHPIAFEFITRSPNQLFFPTIHIHDKEVHKFADFDHHLYYQGDGFSHAPDFTKTTRSQRIASDFMDVTKTMGLVDGQQECHAIVMSGRFPNQDTVITTV